MSWYIKVLEQYADFSGRARRKEYWMFILCNMGVSFALGIVCALLKLPTFVPHAYNLLIFVPSLAVAARRMHDCGKSGWFLLVPFYNFYLLCQEGETGENRFGPDPKPPESNPFVSHQNKTAA